MKNTLISVALSLTLFACNSYNEKEYSIEVYQTSSEGDKLTPKDSYSGETSIQITIDSNLKFQSITGFGGAFTESSAHLLNKMSKEKREEILRAYFSEDGAQYSLTRTHMNSCDFSLDHYSYSPLINDTALTSFSIMEDMDDIIPMIKDAQEISKNGFKIVASPWTAPPWMKDNNDWYGGKLKKEFYPAWARFFSKYIQAYAEQEIDIWAVTVENEPLGNDANWESMHYTPEETADFVKYHLAPNLKENGLNTHILVYDQNRGEELEEWASVLLTDPELSPLIYGTAVHWYNSTVSWFPESLHFTHELDKNKHIINTEACVDAEIPHWNEDNWYWKKEATDWGWDWASEEKKHFHPKYVPTYRYARDIIGCLNNWVEGWIDWNMVLDKNGGPNLAQNWCVAPILVDTLKNEVYYTPLYYTLTHFSKFIKPNAKRIGFECSDHSLLLTAAKNPDGSVAIIVLNTSDIEKKIKLNLGSISAGIVISKQAIQSIIIKG